MKHVTRNIENQLLQLLTRPASDVGVILVEGSRQVGKTTLVEKVLESVDLPVFHFNLELDALLGFKIDSCLEFVEFQSLMEVEYQFDINKECVLFIDEAQESSQLGKFVRFMKENWDGPRVILTGSSLTRLFRNTTRYPVGRTYPLYVRPFTFAEYLSAINKAPYQNLISNRDNIHEIQHNSLLEYLNQYLVVGGMPGVISEYLKGEDLNYLHSLVLATYRQDFIRLFGEKYTNIVEMCLKSVSNFVGSPHKLTTALPKNHSLKEREFASEVFRRLQDWHIVLNSSQKGQSPERSHHLYPKKYLFDTGLLRHIRESSVPSISLIDQVDADQRRPLGGIIENQVAITLNHKFLTLDGWKKSSTGTEVDFIVKYNNCVTPIECKAALTIKNVHLRGIKNYMVNYKAKLAVVVSLAPFEIINVKDVGTVINLPLYLIDSIAEVIKEYSEN